MQTVKVTVHGSQ